MLTGGPFLEFLAHLQASGREPEHWYDQDVNNDFTRNPLRYVARSAAKDGPI